jgi:Chitobiase/beta-hexosaminidase C-terminal domain/Bacterial Ig-like domain (group 3)/Bacterial Ig-like domain (group 1)/FG-GAP-like repeat/Beta-propeller repeat
MVTLRGLGPLRNLDSYLLVSFYIHADHVISTCYTARRRIDILHRIASCHSSSRYTLSVILVAFLLPLYIQAEQDLVPRKPSLVPKMASAADYANLPMIFEVNEGQIDPQVQFSSKDPNYSLFLTSSKAVLVLRKDFATRDLSNSYFLHGKRIYTARSVSQDDIVQMQLDRAKQGQRLIGEDKLSGIANYFIGNNPERWQTNVPTFRQVKYADPYPGIDLVYHGNGRQLEYDFIVKPGAKSRRIRLRFLGPTALNLDSAGDLQVSTKGGQIVFRRPIAYQDENGARRQVDVSFVLLTKDTVGFSIGHYDPHNTLVIDPTLAYSTYIGGSGSDEGHGIAVDSSGSAYVTGMTSSIDFPVTSGVYQGSYPGEPTGQTNVFVTKLSPDGKTLVYSTYLGGGQNTGSDTAGEDKGNAIAVDANGNAYICGSTSSPDFPTTSGAFQRVNETAANGQASPFVTKLSPDGSQLVYSTIIGGTGDSAGNDDVADAIAVDPDGNIYITGGTFSSDFPIKNPYQSKNKATTINGGIGASNAFVTKLNAAGNALIYSTYFGGSGVVSFDEGNDGEGGSGIAIDAGGDAFIAGQAYSTSPSFPTTPGAYQPQNRAAQNEASNAFVAKFDPTGSNLLYSTYIGGSGRVGTNTDGDKGGLGDAASALAIDTSGNAYLTGYAYSNNFPTFGALQPNNRAYGNNSTNAFVTKLNAVGSDVLYSTYLGGSGAPIATVDAFGGDFGTAIAVDPSEDVYVFGFTYSSNFPTQDAFQPTNKAAGKASDGFLSELNATGSQLLYSTYLGGSGELHSGSGVGIAAPFYFGDIAYGLALDGSGAIYVTGGTYATDFPSTVGVYQTGNKTIGEENAFVSKFYNGTAATLTNATTTTLTSSAYQQTAGLPVTFTAVAQASMGSGTPTGTVLLTIDNVTTTIALDSTGHANYTTNSLTGGIYNVTAIYSGNTTYLPSDDFLLQVITQSAPTTISIVSGSGQTSPVGTPFPIPLVVIVKDGSGNPVPGASVNFIPTGVSLSTSAAVTGTNGEASVTATPLTTGVLMVIADVSVPTGVVTFTFNDNSVATPIFQPPAGTYASTQTVTITDTTAGAMIYYTTDGSKPTSSSNRYTGPIAVSSPETIAAIAITPGNLNSAEEVATYAIVGLSKTLISALTATSATIDVFGLGLTAPSGQLIFTDSSSGHAVAAPVTLNTLTAVTTFLPQVTTSTGANTLPDWTTLEDVNGDGILDQVASLYNTDSVSVQLGNGDGTFQTASTILIAPGFGPAEHHLVSLRGNRVQDLIVGSFNTNQIAVLLGNGDGTFQNPVFYTLGSSANTPTSLTSGDFDRDGNLDVAVANTVDNTVSILLGNGSGALALSNSTIRVGRDPEAIRAGDFNSDGYSDLAVANYVDGTVTILLNNKNGTFTTTPITVGTGPQALAINGSGSSLLLAVANYESNTVSILSGKGDGTFGPQIVMNVDNGPDDVNFADFNGDGIPDLAVANYGGNSISPLLGKPGGGYTVFPPVSVGENPYSAAVGDVDGNGTMDLAVSNSFSNNTGILLGGMKIAVTYNGLSLTPGDTLNAAYIPDRASKYASSTSSNATVP